MRHQESRNYIEYLTVDENLIDRVDRYLEDNFKDLFTPAMMTGTMYTLTDADARGLLRFGDEDAPRKRDREASSFNLLLKSVLNSMEMVSIHPKYKLLHQQNILQTIHGENKPKASFRKLISDLKKYLRDLSKESFQWNVVWYSEYKARGGKVDF